MLTFCFFPLLHSSPLCFSVVLCHFYLCHFFRWCFCVSKSVFNIFVCSGPCSATEFQTNAMESDQCCAMFLLLSFIFHLPSDNLNTKASAEVKVRLVESDAEASKEAARCSERKSRVELQVCNSRPMRSMCHDDDGIYRFTLLYMNLAQIPAGRMQDHTKAHCSLFISPLFHRYKPPKTVNTTK